MRLAWADPHGAARAKAVTVPAFLAALETGYNINVATTTLDSANARTFAVVHARRRDGPRRDDGLAQSHHRSRSCDLSRAAVGAAASAGCCAMNISTAACRFISRPGNCCASSSSGSRTRAWACIVGLEIEWYLLRVAQEDAGRREHRHSRRARAADQDRAGRAGLFLSLRNQHGLDAAGALRARRAFRDDRIAAAIDRERVGTGAGRMHVRRAAGAGGGRPRAAVSHRDAANLPPDGPFRHLHVPAGAQGLLFQRLASASVAGRPQERAQPVHARTRARTFVAARPRLSRRLDDIRRRRDRVCHADGQRLSPISAELARTRPRLLVLRPPRRDGPRAGRAGRSGDAAGEPDRRALRQPLPLYPVADRRRP